jgi:hypothetical protein
LTPSSCRAHACAINDLINLCALRVFTRMFDKSRLKHHLCTGFGSASYKGLEQRLTAEPALLAR